MKKILAILILCMPVAAFADTAPTTKLVCHPTKDRAGKVVKNPNGSVKQTCRNIKIHKKYDGTPVPKK